MVDSTAVADIAAVDTAADIAAVAVAAVDIAAVAAVDIAVVADCRLDSVDFLTDSYFDCSSRLLLNLILLKNKYIQKGRNCSSLFT